MRELLFRGKKLDTNEWVYGGYARLSNHACFYDLKYTHFIMKDEFIDIGIGALVDYEVIPGTVGEYTGLTDKNNKKIFEGDILKFSDRLVVVFWNTHIGYWDSYFLKFTDRSNDREDMSSYTWKYKSEVIGNIHDNPELMKGDAK